MTLGHVGGVFVVLLGGIGMAAIMAFLEFMWKARKLARDDNVCSIQLSYIIPEVLIKSEGWIVCFGLAGVNLD